jgi:hypothetical protein
MKRLSSASIKIVAVSFASVAAGFAIATLVKFQGTDNSPQFYGAFAASLVAAIALIGGAFFNDSLSRSREEETRTRDRIAGAIDLHFWMDHCAAELDFIASALARLHAKLVSENKSAVDFSLNQFKDMISSHFYDELLDRAKSASKLPPEIAGFVTSEIYKAFTTADRILGLNHASEKFLPSTQQIDQYAKLVSMQKEKLKRTNSLVGEYLIQIGALPRFPDE